MNIQGATAPAAGANQGPGRHIAEQGNLLDSSVVRAYNESPGYVRVVLDNPPLNLVDGAVFAGLNLLRDVERDAVKVVVFESADPDFSSLAWISVTSPACRTCLARPIS
jgi:hypothetical protein